MNNRTAVLTTPGTIEIQNRARPVPQAHEVIVEILAVGVCGSDIHYFTHGRIGDFVVESPLVLGHESSGRIVEIGSSVTRVAIGDRVAVEPGVPCGRCTQCRMGRYNLCPDVAFLATPPIDGAFTQYLATNEDFVHPVPDSLSDAAAALIEPLSVALWANVKADTSPHTSVLVTGAGPVGLLAASVARIRGAGPIMVTDISPERLAIARDHGFSAFDANDRAVNGFQPDVLIECSGSPQATATGIRALAPAGKAILVGMAPDSEILIPTAAIQSREITLTGTFRYANIYPTAIELARSGAIDLARFVSREFGLDDVAVALATPARDHSVIKVVVRPQITTLN
jgi:L-iditol 2-dehydrogenase